MNTNRIIGALLLAAGAVLIAVGIIESRSLADSVSRTFLGRFTQGTTWYLLGGIASAVVGLLLTVGRLGRAK
jgi:drug/metabolite transporter (DMT)-like permease